MPKTGGADLYIQYYELTTPDSEADWYNFMNSWSGGAKGNRDVVPFLILQKFK